MTTGQAAQDGSQLSDWLRRARATAGLTQEELAERSGIAVRTISDLERGRTRRPYARSVRLLAAALGAPFPGGAAGPAAVPRQLPARAPAFASRDDELADLSQLLHQPGGIVVIAAISGFDSSGAPMTAEQTLRLLLEILQIPADWIPLSGVNITPAH